MLEVALILIPISLVVGVLNLPLGLVDLTGKDFNCPQNSVDEVSEGNGTIIIFGGLLEYLYRNVTVELVLARVGLGQFVQRFV